MTTGLNARGDEELNDSERMRDNRKTLKVMKQSDADYE